MKKGDRVALPLDGKIYDAKYLGRGKYSQAFQVGNRVVLLTQEDCAKEVLARYQYDRMMHLPELVEHDWIETGTQNKINWHVYSSPFYKNVTVKDGEAYRLMKAMIKFWNQRYYEHAQTHKPFGLDVMRAFVKDMKESGFPKSVIRALSELAEVSGNCGDQAGFDFHKGNFGVNEYGVLIFRDLVNPLQISKR